MVNQSNLRNLGKILREADPIANATVPRCIQSVCCYCSAGDVRANEQSLLTLQHVVWLRMHNDIESRLHRLNAAWDGEKLFQESRKIVSAIKQHVTYNEFLPLLLGKDNLEKYDLELETEGYFTGENRAGYPCAAILELEAKGFFAVMRRE